MNKLLSQENQLNVTCYHGEQRKYFFHQKDESMGTFFRFFNSWFIFEDWFEMPDWGCVSHCRFRTTSPAGWTRTETLWMRRWWFCSRSPPTNWWPGCLRTTSALRWVTNKPTKPKDFSCSSTRWHCGRTYWCGELVLLCSCFSRWSKIWNQTQEEESSFLPDSLTAAQGEHEFKHNTSVCWCSPPSLLLLKRGGA